MTKSLSLLELTALAVGTALIVGALAWRVVMAVRARRLLAQALRHPLPSVRADAVAMLGERGIGGHSRRLLMLAQNETEDTVIRELVAVVRKTQWEPADRRALVELRLWARRVCGPQSSVAPTPTSVPATAVAEPEPAPASEPRSRVQAPPPATEPVPPSELGGRLSELLGEPVTVVRAGTAVSRTSAQHEIERVIG